MFFADGKEIVDKVMRRKWSELIILAVLACAACGEQRISDSKPILELRPSPTPTPDQFPEGFTLEYDRTDSLKFDGYQIDRLTKKVKVTYSQEMNVPPDRIDVSYAVLRKNGKRIAKFDAHPETPLNTIDFGLFSFLGSGKKQLAISQTEPRTGEHWLVDLSDGRIIFDSGDWGVGRDEFGVVDIDQDGVLEISLPLIDFYMFENMSMAETPLPEIIFKYDKKSRKYLPANSIFRDYALSTAEEQIARLKSPETPGYLSDRLDIVLQYIYAGEEQKAWQFFDQEYTLPNKEEIRSKVKNILAREPVHRYLYPSAHI